MKLERTEASSLVSDFAKKTSLYGGDSKNRLGLNLLGIGVVDDPMDKGLPPQLVVRKVNVDRVWLTTKEPRLIARSDAITIPDCGWNSASDRLPIYRSIDGKPAHMLGPLSATYFAVVFWTAIARSNRGDLARPLHDVLQHVEENWRDVLPIDTATGSKPTVL